MFKPYRLKKGEEIIAIDIYALRAKEQQKLKSFVRPPGKWNNKI
jgi:hypothetical protein